MQSFTTQDTSDADGAAQLGFLNNGPRVDEDMNGNKNIESTSQIVLTTILTLAGTQPSLKATPPTDSPATAYHLTT